jgi:hypothetical protein
VILEGHPCLRRISPGSVQRPRRIVIATLSFTGDGQRLRSVGPAAAREPPRGFARRCDRSSLGRLDEAQAGARPFPVIDIVDRLHGDLDRTEVPV